LDAPPGILRTLFSAEHSPFVAAAMALLAEGHAPETEIAMRPAVPPREQIVDAHRFLESNDQIGKVLLRSCSKANWPIGR
jgi:hypothetical protein